MIETFEQVTEDLTDREMEYLPEVKEALKLALDGGFLPRKQAELTLLINNYLIQKHGMFCALNLNGVRLRKYINYIRSNSIMPIIATSQGYSLTVKKDIIESQIRSLEQRARSISKAAEGLRKFLII